MNHNIIAKLAAGEALTADESRLHFAELLQPSTRKWSTVARTVKRHALIFEVVNRYRPNVSRAEQARWLHQEATRYQSGAWRRDRDLEQCPQQYAGKPAAFFWSILKFKDALPCERALTFILRDVERARRYLG